MHREATNKQQAFARVQASAARSATLAAAASAESGPAARAALATAVNGTTTGVPATVTATAEAETGSAAKVGDAANSAAGCAASAIDSVAHAPVQLAAAPATGENATRDATRTLPGTTESMVTLPPDAAAWMEATKAASKATRVEIDAA
jgi:hypothetical protein